MSYSGLARGKGLLCLLGVLVTLAAAVAGHAAWMAGYLRRTSDIVFESSTGVATPRTQLQQGFSLDGLMWLDHAMGLGNSDAWRIRHTNFDNPPFGREVHWNSGWAWWLRGLGKARSYVTQEPLETAVERAAVWANLPMLILGMVVIGAWTWKYWGGAAGALLITGIALHRDFYEAFAPGNPDHHGPITLCVLGMLTGILLAGIGWWRLPVQGERRCLPTSEGEAIRTATWSAVWGAVGLWMSAASLIVPIAATGAAAVVVSWLLDSRLTAEGARYSSAVWSRWGRVGGAFSLAFYALEYAPHFPLDRLEINHPLYAVGWWGGAEIVAAIIGLRHAAEPERLGAKRRLVLGLCGALGLVYVFLRMRDQGLVFAQPFLARVYHYVGELKPIWTNFSRDGLLKHADHGIAYLLPLVLAPIGCFVRRFAPERKLLLGAGWIVAVVLTIQGWLQMRWLLIAGGAQITLVALCGWNLVYSDTRASRVVHAARGFVLALLIYVPGVWLLWAEVVKVERLHDVRRDECYQLFYRDVANALLRDRSRDSIVLLASPDASVCVAYYGGVRTVGTLYWENVKGLENAARIWMARTDDEAAALVRECGVTHILVSSPHDFDAAYHDALRPAWPLAETFDHRLKSYQFPDWLRPVEYAPPKELRGLQIRGELYAVDFTQSPIDAGVRQARFLLQRGATREALGRLDHAASAGNLEAATLVAWIAATSPSEAVRNGALALKWAKVVVEAQPDSVNLRMVLAAAFAENGRFAEANGAIFYALDLAEQQGLTSLLSTIRQHAAAYQNGRPWRE